MISRAKSLKRDGEVSLRLAVVHFQPMFARLIQEVSDCLLVGRSHGSLLEEKAAAIKVKGISRTWDVLVGMRRFLDVAVMFFHPIVEPVQGAHRRVRRDIDP